MVFGLQKQCCPLGKEILEFPITEAICWAADVSGIRMRLAGMQRRISQWNIPADRKMRNGGAEEKRHKDKTDILKWQQSR